MNTYKITSFFGVFILIFICWLFSEKKKQMPWRLIIMGVVIQYVMAMIILWSAPGRYFFAAANDAVNKVLSFSDAGAALVFGENFREHFFAFSVLPTIIFVSCVMSVLFYFGVIQKVVHAMAVVMVKMMNASGSESLAASANIFVGQTEAPLVIKPYIATMTRSELMCLMVGGMANIAGGVMAAFVSFGVDAGHLLAASLMSAPACIVCAKILLPETENSPTRGKVTVEIEKQGENVIDAACIGAGDGLKLAANVAAMLIAFVALTAMLNYFMGMLPYVNGEPLSFERVLGWMFSPIAYVLGMSWEDASIVGRLLGKKMFLNEFVAYLDLKEVRSMISERAFVISTYALCGFANFSSIAIQIGGIGGLVPSRKKDIAQLGFKAMIGGTISTLMAAAIAGVLLD